MKNIFNKKVKTDNEENLNNDNNLDNQDGLKEKQSLTSRIKSSFSSKKFKGGAYTTIISIVVIVIVLFVNVIATELDLKVDVSKDNMYTLSDKTTDYVKKIKDDITIYYLAQSGQEDEMIQRIMDKYDSIGGNVKVEVKDPILNPTFTTQYVDNEITNNSILVVDKTNDKVKYIDNADLFEYEIDSSTYQQYASKIDVEGQVTAALQYVTTENLPVMYSVTGHGELDITDTLNTSLAKINVTTESLSTLSIKEIPEDCDILLINGPDTDYSEDEVNMIKTYMEAGGDVIVFANYAAGDMTNFNEFLKYYGVNLVDGIVLENDQNHMMGQYANNLIANVGTHDITTTVQNDNSYVVVPNTKGIEILDNVRDTLEATPLLTTSDSAFSKININSNSASMEDGDIAGPFNLGVAVKETYNDVETNLTVFGSQYIIDDNMLTYPSLGNLDLFLDTVNYETDQQDTLAIEAKSVLPSYLTLNAAQANFWAALVVILIPVIILALGGYVTIRRRKK